MILRRAAASLALLALAGCAHSTGAGTWPVEAPEKVEAAPAGQAPKVSAVAYQHYLDALLAKNAEDYNTAATELREALLYDPGSPHLHAVLAEVLLKQGRVADAEAELKTALSLDPAHGPSHLLAGRIAAARGQPMVARDHYQAALDADPDDPDAWRELARLSLAAGDLDGAEALATRLGARLQVAQKLARGETDDDALVTADRLRDQAAALWVEIGRAHAQHGNDAAAQRAFAQARAASPADPDALIAEATWLEGKRKYPEARERYLRLLAQRPEAPEILAALARVALSEGDVEAVTAHARKLRGLAAGLESGEGGEREDDRRDVSGALLRVAVALLGAHRGAEAQDALDAALRLYPHHAELSFYRALALAQRGRVRDGAIAFEAVARRLPLRRASRSHRRFWGSIQTRSPSTRASRRRSPGPARARRRTRCDACGRSSPSIPPRKASRSRSSRSTTGRAGRGRRKGCWRPRRARIPAPTASSTPWATRRIATARGRKRSPPCARPWPSSRSTRARSIILDIL